MSRKHHSPLVNILLVLIALLTVADITVIGLCLKTPGSGNQKPGTSQNPTEGPDAPEETEPQETRPTPVSTATVLSTGDMLMHSGVIATGKQEDGSYNFDSIFRYVNSYTQAADFSVANLETTLCGTDNGYRYSGNPKFNCPDAIVDSLKSAGFDLLLTANNHAADTSLVGFKRTLTTVREKGLETLGTYLSSDEQKWTIQEVNGIKIGMVCYTYSEGFSKNGYPVLNYNEVAEHGIVNSFTYDKLGDFYTEIGGYLEAMKQAGADTTLVYLHWGDEYKWSSSDAPNSTQTAMAQKLCDLGFDVIVGGHPHVVQPLDLLQSTLDPAHQTVILYSMGNAVSNQRKEELTKDEPTGHTEDSMFWYYDFQDYALEYMLTRCQEDVEKTHLCIPGLIRLMDYDRDHGTEYFSALRTYVEEKYSVTHTAERLFVHRTTLLKHLKKIDEITNMDLDDWNTRLHLCLSFQFLSE